MHLHDSVRLCKPCDQVVAVIEFSNCAECGKDICPDCAIATKDPDLSVCSHLCGAKVAKRIREQDTTPEEAA